MVRLSAFLHVPESGSADTRRTPPLRAVEHRRTQRRQLCGHVIFAEIGRATEHRDATGARSNPFGMIRGGRPQMRTLAGPVVLFASLSSLTAQWPSRPTDGVPRMPDGKPNLSAPAPRAADGKPDLSGVWNKISPKYARNIAADLKPGDVQPWAEKLVEERKENLERDYMSVLCVPLGP